MIRLLLFISVFALINENLAQQSTSFIFSDLQKSAYNPAYATYKNQWTLNAGHRLIMNSYPGSPMNNLFAFNTNINKKHGLGIVVSQNSRSVFKEFEGYINYGYSVRFGSQWKLGLGLGAGIKSQSIDLSNQVYFQQDDPYFSNQKYSGLTYDVRFGGYLSSDRFIFHFSALQLAGQRFNDNIADLNQNFLGGMEYRFDLPADLVFEPKVSANYYLSGVLQYNLGGEIKYKNLIGIGAYYRSDYAITPTISLQLKGVKLEYGFDLIQLGEINYGMGHEISLKFSKSKYDSKIKMISKEEAADQVYELIDTYFDVQSSDLNLVEKKKLMADIRNDIYELLPYMDDESRKQIENSLNKKPKKKKKGSEK